MIGHNTSLVIPQLLSYKQVDSKHRNRRLPVNRSGIVRGNRLNPYKQNVTSFCNHSVWYKSRKKTKSRYFDSRKIRFSLTKEERGFYLCE